jgi:hypothetical protein
MDFVIKFVFMDGKDLNMEMTADAMDGFFSSLSQKQVFWNQEATRGFWLDLDKIRYVHFFAKPQPPQVSGDEQKSENQAGSGALPSIGEANQASA